MNDLKIFAENLEGAALDQINALAEAPAFEGAKIRIMPDAHAGAGCVIGFTAELGDKVVPNLVGVDIGCGMAVQRLPYIEEEELEGFDAAVKASVPSGFAVHEAQSCCIDDFMLLCFDELKNVGRLEKSMGTLDEAPDAYKPSQQILDALRPTVHVIEHLSPIYNFKAVEQKRERRARHDG